MTASKSPEDIAVITTIHAPFDARIYERGLRAAVEHGYRVRFIGPWEEPAEPWIEHRWTTLKPARTRKERILHSWRTFKAARAADARCYHFHDIDFLLWAVLLKAIKGVPVIYDCHENYPEETLHNKKWIPAPLRTPASLVTRVVENWAVRRLRHVVVVLPNLVERFSKLGVEPALVRNFTNWSARRDLAHERRSIICTSGLSETYGGLVLLDIAREIKRRDLRVRLVVADRFRSDEMRARYRAAIDDEGLDIFVHPLVKPKEMDKLLATASIGIAAEQDVPSQAMGYHAKLFEYMAMGMPIVASGITGNRLLVETAGCGELVAAHDAAAYVDAIARILDDEALFERYRERAFAAIEGVFSWRNEKGTLLALYESLIGPPAAGSAAPPAAAEAAR